MTYKNFARMISEDLNIEYKDVLNMTLKEVMKRVHALKEQQAAERKEDEKLQKRLELLMPDYEWFHEKLGDHLIAAMAMREECHIFAWNGVGKQGIDYHDPTIKELVFRESTRSSFYCNYHDNFLVMREWYYIAPIISDAVKEMFPEFVRFSLAVDKFNGDSRHSTITFLLREYNPAGGNEQCGVINNMDDCYDDTEEYLYDAQRDEEAKQFTCHLESFLNMDENMMLEDFFETNGLYDSDDLSSDDIKKRTDVVVQTINSSSFIDLMDKVRQRAAA